MKHENINDHNHHSPQVHHHAKDEKSLKISIIITFSFLIAEIIGAILSGSLTLLADAFHMLRDGISLIISLAAIRIAKRIPTKEKTFGYHRVEIFAALINGIFLILVSIWMVIEAVERINGSHPIEPISMLIIGIIGLAANIYAAIILHGSEDLNIRSAFLHVLGDTISSVIVVIGAIWIMSTGQDIIDPILSFFLSGFILFSGFGVIKEATQILLEFTPKGINLDEIIEELESVDGVEEIHDFHIWGLSSLINAAIMHVLTNEKDISQHQLIKQKIREILDRFNVKHITTEFECEKCEESCSNDGACVDL